MKSSSRLGFVLTGLVASACAARAQVSFTETFDGVDLTIPDGTVVGVSDTRTLATGLGGIAQVQVTLEIQGGYTGDLYAILMHDGVSAVLLNRPGRRVGDGLGYDDTGLNVTFSDSAAADVHPYRLEQSGSHLTPLGGPLAGVWQPDARTASPDAVLDTSPRLSFLNAFIGHTPDGTWTLFVADMSPVGEATLQSWSIHVMVPEPAGMAGLLGLGLLGWAAWTRRGGRPHPA